MSLVKANRVQLGLSATASQNFTLDASAADGTAKLSRGNAGASTQDLMTVATDGKVDFPAGLLSMGASTERIQLFTSQPTTSGTLVDFTGIPAWAKRITVMLSGVSTNGSSQVLVRLGAGSVQSSGYNGVTLGYSGTYVASANLSTGFTLEDGGDGGATRYGQLILTNTGSGNVWVAMGNQFRSTNTGSTTTGGVALSGTLDRIRLTTTNGTDTFDGGSVNILVEG